MYILYVLELAVKLNMKDAGARADERRTPNPEPGTQNPEPNLEPEHEPRSENREA
jgi:hypothetical protein